MVDLKPLLARPVPLVRTFLHNYRETTGYDGRHIKGHGEGHCPCKPTELRWSHAQKAWVRPEVSEQ